MGVRSSLTLIVVLALWGCRPTPRAALHASPDAPATLSGEFRRERVDAFSPQERAVIAAARRAIRKSGKLPRGASEDAYYRVRHTVDGYRVFVVYVTSYKDDQPQFTPCVHNEVFLREDASLLRVLGGPECWPSP